MNPAAFFAPGGISQGIQNLASAFGGIPAQMEDARQKAAAQAFHQQEADREQARFDARLAFEGSQAAAERMRREAMQREQFEAEQPYREATAKAATMQAEAALKRAEREGKEEDLAFKREKLEFDKEKLKQTQGSRRKETALKHAQAALASDLSSMTLDPKQRADRFRELYNSFYEIVDDNGDIAPVAPIAPQSSVGGPVPEAGRSAPIRIRFPGSPQ